MTPNRPVREINDLVLPVPAQCKDWRPPVLVGDFLAPHDHKVGFEEMRRLLLKEVVKSEKLSRSLFEADEELKNRNVEIEMLRGRVEEPDI